MYVFKLTWPDCNNNLIPDECEAVLPGDVNADGCVNLPAVLVLLQYIEREGIMTGQPT